MTGKKYMAELAGTFILTFVITAAVVSSKAISGGPFGIGGMIAVGLAAAIALIAVVYSIGHISGAHVNPAVTIAMWASGKMKARDVLPYIVAQLVGATIAGLFLWAVAGPAYGLGETTAGMFGTRGALGMEFLATAMLVFVILAVTAKGSEHAGLVIGLYLGAAQLFAIPFSGASLNPARSFGPAVLAGGQAWSQLWIYFAGPIIGAIIGLLAYRVFLADSRRAAPALKPAGKKKQVVR
ncbi:MAG: aquaporin [Candidatus Aenigmarchaeota archaeon]|nr:aquaporin [Candidatus Aenigmarchaeota archaeon]